MSCRSGADLLLEAAGKWVWQAMAVNLVTRFVDTGTRLFDDANHAAGGAWLAGTGRAGLTQELGGPDMKALLKINAEQALGSVTALGRNTRHSLPR